MQLLVSADHRQSGGLIKARLHMQLLTVHCGVSSVEQLGTAQHTKRDFHR